ncbi:hypothetical protein JB92DRAFT_3110860 [Gautieria morchelliformis]|nr:hypothetical protein JB92DRAFT_3110860 [Gautieria morchelliformis]
MPWPPHIVAKSALLLGTETIENKFYGLYNATLCESFPSTQFTITPQYITGETPEHTAGVIDFAITYVIELAGLDSPVFFIEIKPPTHISTISDRKEENQLAHLVKIPRIYGVSAMGKQLSYYAYEKASNTVDPVALPDSTPFVIDTAPIERWGTNIMQDEGRDKFLAVVEEIKQMVKDFDHLRQCACIPLHVEAFLSSVTPGAFFVDFTRDPGFFPDPDEFRRERFMEDEVLDVPAAGPLQLVFGFGRSPDQHVAERGLFLTIAMTPSTFTIEKARDS